MLGKTILITFFGLIVGGCASDSKVETMESSGGSSSTAGGGAAVSSPTMSSAAATEPSSTSPTRSGAAATESNSSRNRIAAGVEEETLDTCLAGIPQDATAGQKMLAEQTCRRDFASGRY